MNLIYISKLVNAIRCDKLLWLLSNNPRPNLHLAALNKPLYSGSAEIKRAAARFFFPKGKEVPFKPKQPNVMTGLTLDSIKNGTSAIYNAAFRQGKLAVIIDIIQKNEEGWHICMIKGATRLRQRYVEEVVLASAFLKRFGLPTTSASLIYINKEYVRAGEICYDEVFIKADLTACVVAGSEDAETKLRHVEGIISGDCPSRDIGVYCIKPGDCIYKPSCWSHIPKNSLFELSGKGIDKFDSYKKGIVSLKDIDKNSLTFNQRIQVDAELLNRPFIRRKNIKRFLSTLFFPICFLDFETYQTALPEGDGQSSYEQIPFQYSLHYRENWDTPLKHYEFLAEPGKDPRKELAESLCSLIKYNSCIVVYNISLEKTVLARLAELYPLYKDKLTHYCLQLKDIMVPFQKMDYYVPEMRGSYSLKNVLPALVPSMSYSGLSIGNGRDAMDSYLSLLNVRGEEQRKKIKNDLLHYCRQDTFALVKILERLYDIAHNPEL